MVFWIEVLVQQQQKQFKICMQQLLEIKKSVKSLKSGFGRSYPGGSEGSEEHATEN